MRYVPLGMIIGALLLSGNHAWAEDSSAKTTDQDGRGVIQHGLIPSDQFTIPPDRHTVTGSDSSPKLGTVPEPISPAPILPLGPHTSPMITPGASKAPAVSPPNLGGFSRGAGSR
jgi:hypothetical protein